MYKPIARVLLISLLLCSCASAPEPACSAIRPGLICNDYFLSGAVQETPEKHIRSSAPQSLSVSLNGQVMQLHYQHTTNADFYLSDDEAVLCRTDTASGQLEYASFPIPDALQPSCAEQDYLSWIQQCLTGLGITSLSPYQYTCSTATQVNGVYQQHNGFFLPESAAQSTATHTFRYVKFVGEYPTTDEICITVSWSTGSISISLDPGDFSASESVSIDWDTHTAALDAYIKSHFNWEKYPNYQYETVARTLTQYNGEPCVLFTIRHYLQGLSGSSSGEEQVLTFPTPK